MVIVTDTTVLKDVKLVATVGFFDGVHQGHRFLIRQMKEKADALDLPTAVITFPLHPRKVLQADYQPKLLNSYPEKLDHLAETGIDYCIQLEFTPELASLSAHAFISTILVRQLHVHTLFIGYDHRFGHKREEGVTEYIRYGQQCGMEVVEALPYYDGEISVSSSEIRRQLLLGNVSCAAELLTYPYQLKGNIVRGYKVGRSLGFPTANIRVDEPFKVVPAIGVYAVRVSLQEKEYTGMLYIGNRPTLNNGDDISLEVNIFDFSGDIYNDEIRVSFVKHIRGDIRFDSIGELITQLQEDKKTVMQLMDAN